MLNIVNSSLICKLKYYICSVIKNKYIMKTFKLSIFKGHELKQTKTVQVNTREELQHRKNGFWSESPYRKPLCWMGVKRIR